MLRFLSCVVLVLALGPAALAAGSTGDTVGTLNFMDANGRSIPLDAPGVIYLVDFWAVGCKPCMVEMPDLDRLAKEYGSTGRVRLVSVVLGSSGAQLTKVASDAGTTQEVFADLDDWRDYLGVDGYPTKLLIRDGTVIARRRGGVQDAYGYWKSSIERELKAAPEAR